MEGRRNVCAIQSDARAIENFRSGRTKVLVATDVAARGLDIDAVGLIVNYVLPAVR